jgi:hypothetical protein
MQYTGQYTVLATDYDAAAGAVPAGGAALCLAQPHSSRGCHFEWCSVCTHTLASCAGVSHRLSATEDTALLTFTAKNQSGPSVQQASVGAHTMQHTSHMLTCCAAGRYRCIRPFMCTRCAVSTNNASLHIPQQASANVCVHNLCRCCP